MISAFHHKFCIDFQAPHCHPSCISSPFSCPTSNMLTSNCSSSTDFLTIIGIAPCHNHDPINLLSKSFSLRHSLLIPQACPLRTFNSYSPHLLNGNQARFPSHPLPLPHSPLFSYPLPCKPPRLPSLSCAIEQIPYH